MKIQVRKSCFETNSSSVHSLQIFSDAEWNDFRNGKLFTEADSYHLSLYELDYLKQKYSDYMNEHLNKMIEFDKWRKKRYWNYNEFFDNIDLSVDVRSTSDNKWVAVSISGESH